jgi:long-chain-fatty-acid--[acyl-carrier-protein] ligase
MISGISDILLRGFVGLALSLRYRVHAEGLREVAARGRRGILFLPNHPAFIDPIILGALLLRPFGARFLADKDQIDRFFVRYLAKRGNVIPIPAPEKFGPAAKQAIEDALAACGAALRQGDNVAIYPAGRVMRSRRTEIGAAGAVERILRAAPEARVVLVRTTGLWGSLFSYAHGGVPHVPSILRRGLAGLAASGVVAAPRRRVRIEFVEPADFPRSAGRGEMNRYLEGFYNADAPRATHVPYSIWERGGVREMPEPAEARASGDASGVPAATRRAVAEYLAERTGAGDVRAEQHLARDLGLDSLDRAEVLVWLERQFGFPPGDVEALRTVGDVMLAATGRGGSARVEELPPVAAKWWEAARTRSRSRVTTAGGAGAQTQAEGEALGDWAVAPAGATLAEVFLAAAKRAPGRAIAADAISGVKTYRDLVTGILALRGPLAALPGKRLGIMLPAGVAADVAYLGALLAGKTPVMVNWTVGARNLAHCMELAGVERVVSAGALVGRLEAQGVDLEPIRERLVYLERLAAAIPPWRKLAAWAQARLSWAALRRAAAGIAPGDEAAVLFTSGSETLPKAVPLTHANILANIRGFVALRVLREGDRFLGILPPFHSFGLTVTAVVPLCMGVSVAYWPDPTAGRMIARAIEAYGATLLVGTPTFLAGIVHAAAPGQIGSLRLAITGAEACPDRLYDALERANPGMAVLEGYGITECSPVVSVNRPGRQRRGTVGEPLEGVMCMVVHPETREVVPAGQAGVLLVSGESVFGGYLDGTVLQDRGGQGPQLGTVVPPPSPFVERDGRRWYWTGDLIARDESGVLTFRGRLKRFVKIAGEMVSLPAMEAVLAERVGTGTAEEGPSVAVEAAPGAEPPEVVLFTTRAVDREAANRMLREAGLSPLHNIRRVVRLERIPTLGTGKTDYRSLVSEQKRDAQG